MQDSVERFLARLRDVHPIIPVIFQHGACFELYRIMREIWPLAEPWYTDREGHCYIRIHGRFYDIRGHHPHVCPDIQRMDAVMQRKAFRWRDRNSVGHWIDRLMEDRLTG